MASNDDNRLRAAKSLKSERNIRTSNLISKIKRFYINKECIKKIKYLHTNTIKITLRE